MFDRHKQKAAILFGVADVLLTVCAFEGAYQTRVVLPLERVFFIIAPMKALLLGATLLFWVGIGSWIGAYRRFYGNDSRAAVYDTFLQVLFGTIGLVTFQFLLRLDLSRAFIGLFAAYSLVLLLFYRLLAGRVRGYIRRQFGAEVFYVVVGSGEKALEMGRRLEQTRDYGTQLLAFVDPSGAAGQSVRLSRDYPVKALPELPAMLRRHVIDEIIFTVEGQNLAELEEIFLLCDEEGVKTRVVMDLFPHVNSPRLPGGFRRHSPAYVFGDAAR